MPPVSVARLPKPLPMPASPPLSMPPGPMLPPHVPPPPPIEPKVEWFSVSDLNGAPPAREWVVDEMIPMDTVTLLYGDGGTGKSLLALQLAAAMAVGGMWLNRVPMAGKTVYVSAEDDRAEIHRRVALIANSLRFPLGMFLAITVADLAGKSALLAEVKPRSGALFGNELFHLIDNQIASIGPRLVVMDTLADIYPGNENDRAQVRQFIGLMRGIAIKRKCAVLLLAHPSLTGISSGTGASGSTAWNNSVRSRLYFERIGNGDFGDDPDARRLKVMKSNYGRVGAEIHVRWTDGVFIAQTGSPGIDNTVKARRVFLKLLAQFASEGRRVNAKSGSNYAPKVFAEHVGSEGCTKRAFTDAMNLLLSASEIMIESGRDNGKDVNYLKIR